MAVSYNVNDELINGYITDLESIITDLSNSKAAIGEEFPAEYQEFMQASVKSMYNTEEITQMIDAISKAIANYRDWIQQVLEECHNDDEARAAQQKDTPIEDDSSDSTGKTGDADDSNTTPKNPEQKTVDPSSVSATTPMTQITSPQLDKTGASATGAIGGNNIDYTGSNGTGVSGNGKTGTDNVSGGSKSGNSTNGGSSILNPLGKDNNYGTSGHSVGGSLANSVGGGANGGNGANGSGSNYGAGLSGATSGVGATGDGKGKGLLDNFSELTSGASLGNMLGKGMGSGSIFSLKNGSGTAGDLGTIAKAGLALGLAGAGVGIATAMHEKYYVFDQEDWINIVPSDRESILRKFSEVKMSDGQVELFETSTFKIKADVLDDPAKQLEKVIKDVPDIRQEFLQRYSFDIFSDKGKVDRYLLFILMIIDGQSTITEYNYTTIISDYVEEIDTAYGGLQMEDYIYDFEEEQAVREEIEEY